MEDRKIGKEGGDIKFFINTPKLNLRLKFENRKLKLMLLETIFLGHGLNGL